MEDWQKVKQLFDISKAMAEFSFIWGFMVMIFTTVLDIMWAFYMIKVNQLDSKKAAGYSSTLYFIASIVVISYTHNILYVLSATLGAFLGTYIGVEIEKKKKAKLEINPPLEI